MPDPNNPLGNTLGEDYVMSLGIEPSFDDVVENLRIAEDITEQLVDNERIMAEITGQVGDSWRAATRDLETFANVAERVRQVLEAIGRGAQGRQAQIEGEAQAYQGVLDAVEQMGQVAAQIAPQTVAPPVAPAVAEAQLEYGAGIPTVEEGGGGIVPGGGAPQGYGVYGGAFGPYGPGGAYWYSQTAPMDPAQAMLARQAVPETGEAGEAVMETLAGAGVGTAAQSVARMLQVHEMVVRQLTVQREAGREAVPPPEARMGGIVAPEAAQAPETALQGPEPVPGAAPIPEERVGTAPQAEDERLFHIRQMVVRQMAVQRQEGQRPVEMGPEPGTAAPSPEMQQVLNQGVMGEQGFYLPEPGGTMRFVPAAQLGAQEVPEGPVGGAPPGAPAEVPMMAETTPEAIRRDASNVARILLTELLGIAGTLGVHPPEERTAITPEGVEITPAGGPAQIVPQYEAPVVPEITPPAPAPAAAGGGPPPVPPGGTPPVTLPPLPERQFVAPGAAPPSPEAGPLAGEGAQAAEAGMFGAAAMGGGVFHDYVRKLVSPLRRGPISSRIADVLEATLIRAPIVGAGLTAATLAYEGVRHAVQIGLPYAQLTGMNPISGQAFVQGVGAETQAFGIGLNPFSGVSVGQAREAIQTLLQQGYRYGGGLTPERQFQDRLDFVITNLREGILSAQDSAALLNITMNTTGTSIDSLRNSLDSLRFTAVDSGSSVQALTQTFVQQVQALTAQGIAGPNAPGLATLQAQQFAGSPNRLLQQFGGQYNLQFGNPFQIFAAQELGVGPMQFAGATYGMDPGALQTLGYSTQLRTLSMIPGMIGQAAMGTANGQPTTLTMQQILSDPLVGSGVAGQMLASLGAIPPQIAGSVELTAQWIREMLSGQRDPTRELARQRREMGQQRLTPENRRGLRQVSGMAESVGGILGIGSHPAFTSGTRQLQLGEDPYATGRSNVLGHQFILGRTQYGDIEMASQYEQAQSRLGYTIPVLAQILQRGEGSRAVVRGANGQLMTLEEYLKTRPSAASLAFGQARIGLLSDAAMQRVQSGQMTMQEAMRGMATGQTGALQTPAGLMGVSRDVAQAPGTHGFIDLAPDIKRWFNIQFGGAGPGWSGSMVSAGAWSGRSGGYGGGG